MTTTCTSCNNEFQTTERDSTFLKDIAPKINGIVFNIPHNPLCWECSIASMMAFSNETNLYYRTCDGTGKTIVSNYAPDKPYTVYDQSYWFSDEWDPLQYGQTFDFSKPFFEQFHELFKKVPRMALDQGTAMTNSLFNNHVDRLKDCYSCYQSGNLESCYFLYNGIDDKECADSNKLFQSEGCYECINVKESYELFYSIDCSKCHDSYFLKDCTNCKHCLFSYNQKNKEYIVYNKQVTKEEFEQYKKQLLQQLKKDSSIVQKQFMEFTKESIAKYAHQLNCENSNGEYIFNCKDCTNCFTVESSENVTNGCYITNGKDIHTGCGFDLQRSYYSYVSGGNSSNILFSFAAWGNCSNIFYSDYCFNGTVDCFGCIGLKHKQYCILNKQYTKEEYETLVPKIIAHMQRTGEWGRFFPKKYSPFAYNESPLFLLKPLSKDDALAKGYTWYEQDTQTNKYVGNSYQLEKDSSIYTNEVKRKELLQAILTCEKTKKLYKITPQELAFYIKYQLPLPTLCPEERYRQRTQLMNPWKLWERSCAKCTTNVQSSYAPERSEKIYCETCYQEYMA